MVLFLIFPLVIAVISSYIHFCFWMEMFFPLLLALFMGNGLVLPSEMEIKVILQILDHRDLIYFLIRKADNQKLVNFDGHGRHWIHGADSSRPTVLYPPGETYLTKGRDLATKRDIIHCPSTNLNTTRDKCHLTKTSNSSNKSNNNS